MIKFVYILIIPNKGGLMENLLLKYMQDRFFDPSHNDLSCPPFPFVTVSREFGCPSKLISHMLAESLNQRQGKEARHKWHFINKEIVEESARKLEVNPSKIKYFFDAEHKGIFDDVLASFSSDYTSSFRVKKIIPEVIRSFARRGNIILVGRGGVAITYGCPNSLHVRLQAPLEWRIYEIMKYKNVSHKTAQHMIMETDQKRSALIETLLGRKFDQSLFDIIFNCKANSKEEIVEMMIKLMELKKMI